MAGTPILLQGVVMSIIRTFHNKEKPYVQINTKTLQDYSISLEATGLICRFLSKPTDFIFHIAVICREMKMGRDRLYRILNEIIAAGYGFRFQHKDVKSKRFSGIEYVILEEKATPEEIEGYIEELKKSLPHPDFPDTASSNTANGNLHNIEATDIRKKQQQRTAAVPSSKDTKQKIWPCLEKVDIPDQDKYEITRMGSEEVVKNAIGWATHVDNPPRVCLAASIKYAVTRALSVRNLANVKATPYERCRKLFKNGEKYGSWECYLSENGIAFSTLHQSKGVNFDKYFKWSKIVELCKLCNIKIDQI